MFNAEPREIAQAVCARVIECPGQPRRVVGVAIDSRKVEDGCLFVALVGERVDGNDYVGRALEAGAAAVIMTREPTEAEFARARACNAALLLAASGEKALQDLASWWRDKLHCVVVGVTGSSGKTTTKEMCARVLATKFKTHATAGNLNSTLGAPLTVLSCPLDAEALVVEMGMNAMHEIEAIAAVARPHIGIITNVGTAHIGILGSRLNIARAKSELVAALGQQAGNSLDVEPCVLLWGQDDYTPWIASSVAAPAGVRTLTFGTSEADDASCANVELDELGCAHGTATLPSGASMQLDLGLPGVHNVSDALAAAAMGDLLGIAAEQISQALAGLRLEGNRQQVVRCAAGITLINDCYNANADSMRRALDVLCSLKATRRIACLGDMGELGEDSEVIHAAVGGYAAGKGVDVLVAVGPLSRSMAQAALLMGMSENNVVEVADAAGAANVLKELACEGDALLVKASHSTGLEKTVEAVTQAWA